jgi:hypothetical protein
MEGSHAGRSYDIAAEGLSARLHGVLECMTRRSGLPLAETAYTADMPIALTRRRTGTLKET